MLFVWLLSPFAWLLSLARIRILVITAPGRIGHLVVEPATFLEGQALNLTERCHGVLLVPRGRAANECLIDYWQRHITTVRSPVLAKVLHPFSVFPALRRDIRQLAFNETVPYVAVWRAWGDRPHLLNLTDEHRREGRARLAEWGVPDGAEFVCFHCREGGYSPSDEELHSFRSNSIENYLPAVEALTRRGLWAVRMGDPTMRPIPAMERVIDYAHLDRRSEWMDLFLCASGKFFLGSASGLIYVATVFGKPAASANHAPMSTAYAFGKDDVAIPKLIWSEAEGRYLTFKEVLGSDIGNFRYSEHYREARMRSVENTPEDIRDLSLEMLDRTEGRAVYAPEDEELQRRFRALFRPGHYSYGGINRVGRDFLRKYAFLLGDAPERR